MKNLNFSPVWILIVGFLLVVVGVLIPWLIVLGIIQSTFFLNFLAFGCTFVGVMLGIIGSAYLVRGPRR
jgi:hypothetical protein